MADTTTCPACRETHPTLDLCTPGVVLECDSSLASALRELVWSPSPMSNKKRFTCASRCGKSVPADGIPLYQCTGSMHRADLGSFVCSCACHRVTRESLIVQPPTLLSPVESLDVSDGTLDAMSASQDAVERSYQEQIDSERVTPRMPGDDVPACQPPDQREEVANLRAWQDVLLYWLLRVYVGHYRDGWEDGPSESETIPAIADVLANADCEAESERGVSLLAGPAKYHPDHSQARERPDVAVGHAQRIDQLAAELQRAKDRAEQAESAMELARDDRDAYKARCEAMLAAAREYTRQAGTAHPGAAYVCEAVLAAYNDGREPPIPTRDQRQATLAEWCAATFGVQHAASLPQRAVRLLEESLEAYQSAGADPAMAHRLIDYVFGRPVGELRQELGGVGVCLLALAAAAHESADACEAREVARIQAKPIEHFRARNDAKNAAGFNVTDEEPTR